MGFPMNHIATGTKGVSSSSSRESTSPAAPRNAWCEALSHSRRSCSQLTFAPGGKSQWGFNVFRLNRRKVFDNFFFGHAARKIFENIVGGDSRADNAGFAVANCLGNWNEPVQIQLMMATPPCCWAQQGISPNHAILMARCTSFPALRQDHKKTYRYKNTTKIYKSDELELDLSHMLIRVYV